MILTFAFFKLSCINNYKEFDENALWSLNCTRMRKIVLPRLIKPTDK